MAGMARCLPEPRLPNGSPYYIPPQWTLTQAKRAPENGENGQRQGKGEHAFVLYQVGGREGGKWIAFIGCRPPVRAAPLSLIQIFGDLMR